MISLPVTCADHDTPGQLSLAEGKDQANNENSKQPIRAPRLTKAQAG